MAARFIASGAVAALAVLSLQYPAQAATAATPAAAASASKTPDPTTTNATSAKDVGDHPSHRACAVAQKAGTAGCLTQIRDDVKQTKAQLKAAQEADPSADPAGFGPSSLQSAYSLPSSTNGGGQTVAIVDAFDNPDAEAELATYRTQYGLSACTTANGCFKKIDQRGGTDYPVADAGWGAEIALDIQMVSATCPNCHILLVEADDNYMENLGAAVNQAVAQGAKFVSNSYGGGEGSDESTYDSAYFNHPGVAVTASSGDDGYGVSYPAASPYVTSVGGTSLVKDASTRGWSETVWSGAGSGCSAYEPKPAVQSDSGCDKRTVADVSAVANPSTGVAVYNAGAWHVYGGTSVSAPIIASVYALAGTPASGSQPMTYPYAKPAALNDVTSGTNGSCGGSYLCTGTTGYDGPTGLGTPAGITAFSSGPHALVKGTVTDSSGGTPLAGVKVTAGDSGATTDATGAYTLSVEPGTYDVKFSKFGYAVKTVAGVTLADGQSVTEDAALTAKDRVEITGSVKDGSGHGWPLYATVQIKGEPTSAVHTDPATGAYTLSVPVDDTYTVEALSSYPGYTPASQDIAVADTSVSQDFGVKVDASTCSAAGYQYNFKGGTTEDFSSATGTTPPAGWTIVDTPGQGKAWTFTDAKPRTNHTGGSGAFAIADSDLAGSAYTEDTSLVSPVLDFSNTTGPIVQFASDYKGYSNGYADVDYTTDGGTTWTTASHWTTVSRLGPRTELVDLSAAAGKSAVQIRFHYNGHFAYWWEVDNVFVGDRSCDPTPGGLVLGQVTDKNTKSGIAGAQVVSTDKPAEGATTIATPDDAALGDGFYWFYSTLTGSHPLGYTAGNYTAASKSVRIASNAATTADIKLAAGRLSISPTTVGNTVAWQGAKTKAVTVKNTGTATAKVKLSEQDKGFVIKARGAGAELTEIKGDYDPGFIDPAKGRTAVTPPVTPAAPPWTSIANLPAALMDNAVATGDDGKVYSVDGVSGTTFSSSGYVYNPETTSWSAIADNGTPREAPVSAFFGGKLYLTGGWAESGANVTTTQIYDPSSNSWSTGASIPKGFAGAGSAVVDGKWYVVGGCTTACGVKNVQIYDSATNSWSAGADYPEITAWLGCGGVNGTLYCAGGTNGTATTKHAYSYDASADSWTPVADMPMDLWAMGATGANGRLLLSGGVTNGTSTLTNAGISYDPAAGTWTALPNSNNTVYRGGSACGFYRVGGSIGGFNPVDTAELLPGYGDCSSGSDVSWLSEDRTEVTLAPGASAVVNVTTDASGSEIAQPGAYSALLAVGEDTPYAYAPIDVTMTVNPPSTWGKLAGTVSGAPCTGATAGLKGATLQIDSWAQSFTLKTDANGQYGMWLDVRNNPLQLIAAKDGWAPQARTAKLVKLSTVTQNFTLKPDKSCG
ncbi:carboxypeptidase regulatory-like domain-containing protein [Streptomyces sp. NBC_01465]|uniref:carboxypeptidase regulatory-like domain-containing protein n=1 Tax=Streptomyces sp. NBC_01465 TaxID=2903878 RepID=UPI002E329C1A|nr:carboxypeptidase regulatory-like domain-containing protein [Streptomyces sp. NBC_01465]